MNQSSQPFQSFKMIRKPRFTVHLVATSGLLLSPNMMLSTSDSPLQFLMKVLQTLNLLKRRYAGSLLMTFEIGLLMLENMPETLSSLLIMIAKSLRLSLTEGKLFSVLWFPRGWNSWLSCQKPQQLTFRNSGSWDWRKILLSLRISCQARELPEAANIQHLVKSNTEVPGYAQAHEQ
ncbi:hypothetical protein SADUNF_Sadunf01G0019200 [Salix dunnii]|uniref:Uncharacterized protein n=1 Tax=Salix dunnii TaxID=1413687 RepID=A0A835N996_9ROSI|nr:hypothetical protein SADUNF_Sadunf01G0019200 [Salix dunnii]